jgi:hypothetical protein
MLHGSTFYSNTEAYKMKKRLIRVIYDRHAKTQDKKPLIGVSGKWLDEIGFKQNFLFTVEGSSKTLTLKPFECNLALSELKENTGMDKKLAFFQVRQLRKPKNIVVPAFCIKGQFLEDMEFSIGSRVILYYDFGVINIHVADN